MGYIGAHGVETLKRYRYSGQDHSVVAKYVLQPFWTRCVTLFPLWMPYTHPTSTQLPLGGSILPMDYFSSYTRRTSSSSPLGELFDHGCDALACAFEALALGSTLMCRRLTICFWVVAAVPFYLATWEQYQPHFLVMGTGFAFGYLVVTSKSSPYILDSPIMHPDMEFRSQAKHLMTNMDHRLYRYAHTAFSGTSFSEQASNDSSPDVTCVVACSLVMQQFSMEDGWYLLIYVTSPKV